MGKIIFDFKNEKQMNIIQSFIQNAKVCVVDFYADWCGPCKILGKNLETKILQEADICKYLLTPENYNDEKNQLKNKIVFIKIDIDIFSEMASEYNVSSIPHVVFYKDGKLLSDILRNDDKIIRKTKELI